MIRKVAVVVRASKWGLKGEGKGAQLLLALAFLSNFETHTHTHAQKNRPIFHAPEKALAERREPIGR